MKKNLLLLAFVMGGALLVAGCSGGIPVQTADPSSDPLSPAEQPTEGLREIDIEDVVVEIGQGSPIPVDIIAAGTWPDLCAQLASVRVGFGDTQIDVDLLATPADPDCPEDFLGLPFRLAIPVNILKLSHGTYTVSVNGQQAVFDHPLETQSPSLDGPIPGSGALIPVEAVQVEVGVGSPIPVEIAVSGTWPDLCAQLEGIEMRFQGYAIEVELTAAAPNVGCPADNVGLPFGMRIPINIVELPEGSYSVTVNGVATSFSVPVEPPSLETQDEFPALETDVELILALEDITIYSGPSEGFDVIGEVFGGQRAKVTGISEDSAWWRVICPDDTIGSCWVSADPELSEPAEASS